MSSSNKKCIKGKKYRVYDTTDRRYLSELKYSSIYCPEHGFKSMDSNLDKFKHFEDLDHYLNDRIRTNNHLQITSDDLSDDNYEDIDEQDFQYEIELNSQFNSQYNSQYNSQFNSQFDRYDDQHLACNTNNSHSSYTNSSHINNSHKRGILSKIFYFFINFWYCLIVSQEYKEQMRRRRVRGQGLTAANSVSMIDKTSRILFPFLWLLLNLVYWAFLINERNSDFNMWSDK